MNRVEQLPIETLRFLLDLWKGPDLAFILAGPVAYKPTKYLYEIGLIKQTGWWRQPPKPSKDRRWQNRLRYGSTWIIDRENWTIEEVKTMKSLVAKDEFKRKN